MPWCPVCKNEYREGIKFCADCKAELVEQLQDEEAHSAGLEEQQKLEFIRAMLAENETGDTQEEEKQEMPVYRPYQNSAAKAEDNRTSANMLLGVGIVGFIFVLLVFVDIIPVYQSTGINKYLVCGVMGALFVLFIVCGVVSMRNSKILLIKAKSEDSLLSELARWCRDNLHAEEIDRELFEEGIPEEQKYFRRTDQMKKIINDKFMNLDEALLEHFVDEYYQELFENG